MPNTMPTKLDRPSILNTDSAPIVVRQHNLSETDDHKRESALKMEHHLKEVMYK